MLKVAEAYVLKVAEAYVLSAVMLKIAEAYVDKQISFHGISSLHLYLCGRVLSFICWECIFLSHCLLRFQGLKGIIRSVWFATQSWEGHDRSL